MAQTLTLELNELYRAWGAVALGAARMQDAEADPCAKELATAELRSLEQKLWSAFERECDEHMRLIGEKADRMISLRTENGNGFE